MLARSVRITNPTGLHARPAIKLAQLAAGFKADVRLRVKAGRVRQAPDRPQAHG